MSQLNHKGIVLDGLITHFDLANERCWSPGYMTMNSLRVPTPSTSNDIHLPDFGWRMAETGYVANQDSFATVNQASGLILQQWGSPYNAEIPMNYISEGKQGPYIKLDGYNFLWGFFKLEGYDYEVLPARYAKGFTIETSLMFEQKANEVGMGVIVFMGTRDLNVYSLYPQPEVVTYEGSPLGPDHPLEPYKGVEGNAFGLLLFEDGTLGYRFMNEDLTIEEGRSDNRLSKTGWHNLAFTYTPCFEITDPDLLGCTDRRSGTLDVYVNGLLFHTFEGFPEPMFKALSTEPDKQIGVPYTLSWGTSLRGVYYHLNQAFSPGVNAGGQILRIYERPLSFTEVRENHNAVAPRYDLQLVRGGRVTPSTNW